MNHMALAATMSLLVLSACGTSTQDRALSGGAMGAAAGGVAGLLLDQPVAGALLGGAAGAAAGALTDEDQIDLGKPVWKSSDGHPVVGYRIRRRRRRTAAPGRALVTLLGCGGGARWLQRHLGRRRGDSAATGEALARSADENVGY